VIVITINSLSIGAYKWLIETIDTVIDSVYLKRSNLCRMHSISKRLSIGCVTGLVHPSVGLLCTGFLFTRVLTSVPVFSFEDWRY